jgi:hypothetical protein
MPRRSGGRGYSRSSSYGNRYGGYGGTPYSIRNAPIYTQRPTNPTIYQSPSSRIGLGSTLAHGMAFGGGSAIAHHAFRNMLGGNSYGSGYSNMPTEMPNQNNMTNIQQEPIMNENDPRIKQNPCFDFGTKFIECLKDNSGNISKCQNNFDDLRMCENTLSK